MSGFAERGVASLSPRPKKGRERQGLPQAASGEIRVGAGFKPALPASAEPTVIVAHPKTGELRAQAEAMKIARQQWVEAEAMVHRAKDRTEKLIAQEEFDDAKNRYAKARAEYAGGKVERFLRERIRLTDARAMELAQEKGVSKKIYAVHEKLGEMNCGRLGFDWGPIANKLLSARSAAGLALTGAGFVVGPEFGTGILLAHHVLSGMDNTLWAYDVFHGFAGKKKPPQTQATLSEFAVRLAELEAQTALVGGTLAHNREYQNVKHGFISRLAIEERRAGQTLDILMRKTDAEVARWETKQKRRHRLVKGLALGVGAAMGSRLFFLFA